MGLGAGTVTKSGLSQSNYGDMATSTPAPDGGDDWTTSNGDADWSYIAAGAYAYPIAGGSVSGAWKQSGNDDTNNNGFTDSTPAVGGGSGTNTGTQNNGWGGQPALLRPARKPTPRRLAP